LLLVDRVGGSGPRRTTENHGVGGSIPSLAIRDIRHVHRGDRPADVGSGPGDDRAPEGRPRELAGRPALRLGAARSWDDQEAAQGARSEGRAGRA